MGGGKQGPVSAGVALRWVLLAPHLLSSPDNPGKSLLSRFTDEAMEELPTITRTVVEAGMESKSACLSASSRLPACWAPREKVVLCPQDTQSGGEVDGVGGGPHLSLGRGCVVKEGYPGLRFG